VDVGVDRVDLRLRRVHVLLQLAHVLAVDLGLAAVHPCVVESAALQLPGDVVRQQTVEVARVGTRLGRAAQPVRDVASGSGHRYAPRKSVMTWTYSTGFSHCGQCPASANS